MPSYATLDTTNSLIVLEIPDLTAKESYTFYIQSQATSYLYRIDISIQVNTCELNKWSLCDSYNNQIWVKWESGYDTFNGVWFETKYIPTWMTTMLKYAPIIILVSALIYSIVYTIFKCEVSQGFYVILSHFQLLSLLKAYVTFIPDSIPIYAYPATLMDTDSLWSYMPGWYKSKHAVDNSRYALMSISTAAGLFILIQTMHLLSKWWLWMCQRLSPGKIWCLKIKNIFRILSQLLIAITFRLFMIWYVGVIYTVSDELVSEYKNKDRNKLKYYISFSIGVFSIWFMYLCLWRWHDTQHPDGIQNYFLEIFRSLNRISHAFGYPFVYMMQRTMSVLLIFLCADLIRLIPIFISSIIHILVSVYIVEANPFKEEGLNYITIVNNIMLIFSSFPLWAFNKYYNWNIYAAYYMAISLLLNYWLILTLLVLFSIKAIFTKWNDRHLPIEAIKLRRKLNRIKIKKINIPTLAEQNKTPMHLAKFRDGAEELNVKSEYKIEKETNSKFFLYFTLCFRSYQNTSWL